MYCHNCANKLDCCYKCGAKDSYCSMCSLKLRQHQNKVICLGCSVKHKCDRPACPNMRLYNCLACSKYIREQTTCYKHLLETISKLTVRQKNGLCDDCWTKMSCDICKKVTCKWTHDCGTFCSVCVPEIFIDISPKTLMNFLPENHPCKIVSPYHLLDRCVVKCKHCMNGKSVKDCQMEEIARLLNPMQNEMHQNDGFAEITSIPEDELLELVDDEIYKENVQ